MDEKLSEIKEFCEECEEKTKMRFVKRENEYLIYECSVCDSEQEFLEHKIRKKVEEEMV